MKTTLCLILLGLMIGSAFAGTSVASSTAASFNSTPYKVFDSANTTVTAPSTQSDAGIVGCKGGYVFGAGLTNDTIYVWGISLSTATPGVLSGVIKRTLNATAAASGSDTTEVAVIAADATITLSASINVASTPKYATGGGYLAIGAVAQGTTFATTSTDILMLYTIAGSGSAVTQAVAVATSTAVDAAASHKNYYTFIVSGVWYEDGYFYILYESQQQVGTTSTSAFVADGSAAGPTTTGLSLQAIGAGNGSKLFASPLSVAGSISYAETATGSASGNNNQRLMAIGGGSNYTMSALIQVAWKDPVGLKTYFVTITKATAASVTTGTVGTANTVGTDVAAGTATAGQSYYPGGNIASNYTYGFAIANVTVATSTATAFSQGIMADLNGSVVAGQTTYSATQTQLAIPLGSGTALTPYITLMGVKYGTGFAVVTKTPASTGYNYAYQAYFANGTVNSTSATPTPYAIGNFQASPSIFVDVNGAVWCGYNTYDTTAMTGVQGFLGRLIAQTNVYNGSTTTKAANVLATFAAILTFVIASLFMF